MITNEMKLSKEQIAKVFALYLGCEVATPDGKATLVQAPNIMLPDACWVHFGGKMVHTKNSIDGGYKKVRNHGKYALSAKVMVSIVPGDNSSFDMPGGVQLILKPLSEITDDDKREFLEVTGMEPDGLELFLLGHGSMHLSHLQDWANGVDFLRSKGYALPYMGIDLFESSIAIPKK